MSGHPQGAQYDDGYGQQGHAQGQDQYYHDDQYAQYDQNGHGYSDQNGDGYYDESWVALSPRLGNKN